MSPSSLLTLPWHLRQMMWFYLMSYEAHLTLHGDRIVVSRRASAHLSAHPFSSRNDRERTEAAAGEPGRTFEQRLTMTWGPHWRCEEQFDRLTGGFAAGALATTCRTMFVFLLMTRENDHLSPDRWHELDERSIVEPLEAFLREERGTALQATVHLPWLHPWHEDAAKHFTADKPAELFQVERFVRQRQSVDSRPRPPCCKHYPELCAFVAGHVPGLRGSLLSSGPPGRLLGRGERLLRQGIDVEGHIENLRELKTEYFAMCDDRGNELWDDGISWTTRRGTMSGKEEWEESLLLFNVIWQDMNTSPCQV